MLTIQNQTRAGKIFKCTIFVGYGGVIFFYWCRTTYKLSLFGFAKSHSAGKQSRKAGEHSVARAQLRRCQGIRIGDYSFVLSDVAGTSRMDSLQ